MGQVSSDSTGADDAARPSGVEPVDVPTDAPVRGPRLFWRVLGLASLVVPAAIELAGGGTLYAALDEFGAVRVVHVLLVILATIAMFTPSANAYFRGRRGARAPVGASPSGSLNR